MSRDLSTRQQARLDRLAMEEPAAKVVGWWHKGPVVRGPNGRLTRVTRQGRLIPLAKESA